MEDTYVAARSSSRVSDSDFGVNAKRINFIAKGLRGRDGRRPASQLSELLSHRQAGWRSPMQAVGMNG